MDSKVDSNDLEWRQANLHHSIVFLRSVKQIEHHFPSQLIQVLSFLHIPHRSPSFIILSLFRCRIDSADFEK